VYFGSLSVALKRKRLKMSVFNWIWDFDQDSKISSQEDRMKQLENKVEVLHEWVQYLHKELNGKISVPEKEIEDN
jgi:hypothetical protein